MLQYKILIMHYNASVEQKGNTKVKYITHLTPASAVFNNLSLKSFTLLPRVSTLLSHHAHGADTRIYFKSENSKIGHNIFIHIYVFIVTCFISVYFKEILVSTP